MSDCIFCKIVKGEIPSVKIYEDDKVFAFLDIMPINSGHALVISKEHFQNLNETPDEVLQAIIMAVKKLSTAVMKSVEAQAFNLGVNTGKDAGQVVEHVHFHIIPRLADDGHQLWQGGSYKEGEMEEIAQNIIEDLK